jgi:hypothetical protein
MPTPKMEDALPGQQSLRKRLVDNILNQDFVRTFGKQASTAVAYGLAKKDKPLGEPAHDHQWGNLDAASLPRAKG